MVKDEISVGVVIERREDASQWIDHTWHAVTVLPGAPDIDGWVELARGEGWVRYHAATLPIEIFAGETEGYKYNLSLDPPMVYVVLDPEPDGDLPIEPTLVTVCPYESQDYNDGTEVLVETVAMPPAVAAWVAAFVEAHHVDRPFKKRKRVPHPDKAADPSEPSNELILPPGRPERGDNG